MSASAMAGEAPSFAALKLDPRILRVIEQAGWRTPFDVQARTIPAIRSGRNVIGESGTGTGKTVSFVIGTIHRNFLDDKASRPGSGTKVLVLATRREIARQNYEAFQRFGQPVGLRAALVMGEGAKAEGHRAIADKLRGRYDIISATPGGLYNAMQRERDLTRVLREVRTFVLDEGDELLQKEDFQDQVTFFLREARSPQTLLFSATIPDAAMARCRTWMRNPIEVRLSHDHQLNPNISLRAYHSHHNGHKFQVLRRLIGSAFVPAIVFVQRKVDCQRLADALHQAGCVRVGEAHGLLSMEDRNNYVNRFREGDLDVLVSTALLGRGFDQPGLKVIFYDIPADMAQFIHSAGRTGRGNSQGEAVLLVSPEDQPKLAAIEQHNFMRVPAVELPGLEPRVLDKTASRPSRVGDSAAIRAFPFVWTRIQYMAGPSGQLASQGVAWLAAVDPSHRHWPVMYRDVLVAAAAGPAEQAALKLGLNTLPAMIESENEGWKQIANDLLARQAWADKTLNYLLEWLGWQDFASWKWQDVWYYLWNRLETATNDTLRAQLLHLADLCLADCKIRCEPCHKIWKSLVYSQEPSGERWSTLQAWLQNAGSTTHPSWVPMWTQALERGSTQMAEDLGYRWLEDAGHDAGRWGYVWLKLYGRCSASRRPQLENLARQWLMRAEIGGKFTSVTFQILARFLASDPALQKKGRDSLNALAWERHEWYFLWRTLARIKWPPQVAAQLHALGAQWLERFNDSSNRWFDIWLLLKSKMGDPGLVTRLGYRWLSSNSSAEFMVSKKADRFERKRHTWAIMWKELWRMAESLEEGPAALRADLERLVQPWFNSVGYNRRGAGDILVLLAADPHWKATWAPRARNIFLGLPLDAESWNILFEWTWKGALPGERRQLVAVVMQRLEDLRTSDQPWPFVFLRAWEVQEPAGSEKLEVLGLKWLEAGHHHMSGWAIVWTRLFQSGRGRERLIEMGMKWLEDQSTFRDSWAETWLLIWESMKTDTSLRDQLAPSGIQWLLRWDLTRPHYAEMLTALLEGGQQSAAVVEIAKEWLATDPGHEAWARVYHVIASQLPADSPLHKLAD